MNIKRFKESIFVLIKKFREKNKLEEQVNFDKKLVFALSKSRIPTIRQLKHLFKILSKKEKYIIRGALTIVAFSLLIWGLKIYFQDLKITPKRGGEYIEGLVGSLLYVNPILAQTNDVDMDISRLIYSGLLKINQEGKIIPDLAQRYEISKDLKKYTFHLKKDIVWHDGEKVKADDIIFTVKSIQDPEFKSPLWRSLQNVTVEKLDDYTVKFTLSEPYTPFLQTLTFGLLPEHLWSQVPAMAANLASYNLKPIGSGPFKFKSLIKDKIGNIKSYTLIRNEEYNQPSYLEKITFKFYPDFSLAVNALKNKNIDGLSFLPKEFKEEAKSPNLNYYSLRLPQYTAIFFNQKKNESLKEKEVRMALSYSIDRKKILSKALQENGEIIHGPILPGFIGYNPKIQQYNYDFLKAQDILEKAGWKLKNNKREKDKKILEITLTTINHPENIKAAEIIKKNWQALGIDVKLNIVSILKIQKEIIQSRNYETLLYGEVLGLDPDPFAFWHSSQNKYPGLNLTVFANRRVDQLLEESRQMNDPQERAKKYIHFQNILTAEIPAIFLYRPIYTYSMDKKIKGVKTDKIIAPHDRFMNIEEWYIKIERKWK